MRDVFKQNLSQDDGRRGKLFCCADFSTALGPPTR